MQTALATCKRAGVAAPRRYRDRLHLESLRLELYGTEGAKRRGASHPHREIA